MTFNHAICKTVFGGLVATFFALATGQSSYAVVTSASSDGYGLFTEISGNDGFLFEVGPVPGTIPDGVKGTAPGPYILFDSESNVSANVDGTSIDGSTFTDSINAGAESDVDGLPGTRTTTAFGQVADANIDITTFGALGPITLLSIRDVILGSTAQVTGDFGSLSSSGTTTIQDFGQFIINGIGVDLSAFVGVNIAPNTSVDLGALGITNATLVLNEQIVVGDNEIYVNGFRLQLGLPQISGPIVLGHSHAVMTAVPEPNTFSLVCAALIACCLRQRARLTCGARGRQ